MNTVDAQIAKRLPSTIFKLGAQAFIKRDFPYHIFIETTASCNLSCAYCPREKISKDMDFGLFQKIVDEARSYGPRSFSLHLFGEPLLYPRIFEAVRYIKKSNLRNTVLLTTNGTVLNDCIDDFKECGIDQAYWTWRPEAKFTESTRKKLRKWGKFRVRFIDEITPDKAREEWEEWPNVEGRHLHNYGGEINLTRWKVQPKKTKRWPCYHLWLAPAIAWNGNFLLCCSDPHQKEMVGKLSEHTISELWQKVEGVRQAHLRGEYNGICKDCNVWREYPDLFYSWQKSKSS